MNILSTWLQRRQAVAAAKRPRRVVVHGSRKGRWGRALGGGAPAWDGICAPGEVEFASKPRAFHRRVRALGGDCIVLPLRENNILSTGPDGWGLVPSATAVRTLGDKEQFARYARTSGLGADVPERYAPGTPSFPCVAKLAVGHSGRSVAVVQSADELRAVRRRLTWLGRRVVLQALLEGPDHVLHAVCGGGRVLWSCAYRYELAPGETVQRPNNVDRRQRYQCTAEDIALFERFLVPLGYDGPVAIDFKRRAGRPVIIEINPRLGGSLMRADNVADLHDMLAAIVANAAPLNGAAP